MNIELLHQIKARILAEPDAFRMDTYSCGTAHCIAGWALVLNGTPVVNPEAYASYQEVADGRYAETAATDVLGLDNDTSARLFNVGDWPREFEEDYEWADSRAERASIASRRIDHFIATHGAE